MIAADADAQRLPRVVLGDDCRAGRRHVENAIDVGKRLTAEGFHRLIEVEIADECPDLVAWTVEDIRPGIDGAVSNICGGIGQRV